MRLENGEWHIIAVTEGFSQGCPVSPVCAALVLHDILSKIKPELERRAIQRKAAVDLGDDGHSSVGFSLAYMDAVNAVPTTKMPITSSTGSEHLTGHFVPSLTPKKLVS
jgi:hypothetical protein